MFGVNPTVAAAYTLVLHAALWLPITVLGFWYMARESLNWGDFDKAVAESRQEPTEPQTLPKTNSTQISRSPNLSPEGESPSLPR